MNFTDRVLKEERHKLVDKVWFSLYTGWNQKKLIYDDSGWNSCYSWAGMLTEERQEGTFWVARNISISWFGYLDLVRGYTCIKFQWAVHLRFVHFTVYKEYFNSRKER